MNAWSLIVFFVVRNLFNVRMLENIFVRGDIFQKFCFYDVLFIKALEARFFFIWVRFLLSFLGFNIFFILRVCFHSSSFNLTPVWRLHRSSLSTIAEHFWRDWKSWGFCCCCLLFLLFHLAKVWMFH